MASAPPVTLGDFEFDSFAVPPSINFGGKQETTVLKMPGGQRVINAMGVDDVDITWSGTFLGPDATYDAQTLDGLRQVGQPLPLQWGEFSFVVVIGDLDLKAMFNRIDYRISCIVQTQLPVAQTTTTLTSTNNDLNNALAVPTTLTGVQAAIQAVPPTYTGATALTPGSPTALATLAAIGTAQTAVTAAQTVANAEIESFATSIAATSIASSYASIVMATGTAVANAAALQQMSGYLGRAAFNLAA